MKSLEKEKRMAVHGNIKWGKWTVQQIRGTKRRILQASKGIEKQQQKTKQTKETKKKTGKFVSLKETSEYFQTAKQWGSQTTSLVFLTGKMKIALSHVFFACILSETLIY